MAGAERRVQVMHLTDRAVERLPLVGRDERPAQRIVADDAERGFFLVIGRAAKTYTIQGDLWQDGVRVKQLRRAIGRSTEISAEKARARAKVLLGQIKSGVDPDRPPRRGGVTLREAHAEYIAACRNRGRSQVTIDGYENTYERHLSLWADVPLRKIASNTAMRRELHRKLSGAPEEPTPARANAVLRQLRATYNCALEMELDKSLPVVDLGRGVVFHRNSDPPQTGLGLRELAAWWRDAQLRAPSESGERAQRNPIRRELHLFCLLSGMRKGALTEMEWQHLDVRARTFFVPNPKGGPKKAFHLRLSRAQLRCLWRVRYIGRKMHPDAAARWVWPSGGSASGHITETKERDMTHGHDLRRTYRTVAAEIGVPTLLSETLLNHSSRGNTHDRYAMIGKLGDVLAQEHGRICRAIVEALAPRAEDRSLLVDDRTGLRVGLA